MTLPNPVRTCRPMISNGSPRIVGSDSISSSSRASDGIPTGDSRIGLSSTRHNPVSTGIWSSSCTRTLASAAPQTDRSVSQLAGRAATGFPKPSASQDAKIRIFAALSVLILLPVSAARSAQGGAAPTVTVKPHLVNRNWRLSRLPSGRGSTAFSSRQAACPDAGLPPWSSRQRCLLAVHRPP